MNYRGLIILLVSFIFSVLAASSVAQQPGETSNPKYVATVTSTGYVPLYDHTKDLQDGAVLTIIQITATTDATYNFWRYDPSGQTWDMICPRLGATAADSVLTLSSGQSETYWFNKTRPSSMNLVSGTITIKGE